VVMHHRVPALVLSGDDVAVQNQYMTFSRVEEVIHYSVQANCLGSNI
jgi:D-aminopeptidase